MSALVGRNDPCPCGSGKKYKRCCIDRRTGDSPPPRGELQLLVETPGGAMVRTVPSASPLADGVRTGRAAEAATQDAAAVWGLPDFVYLPESAALASGTRELGDGLLVVGDLGVVVQVKSRENPGTDTERERSWLAKKASDGIRQGNGTVRFLKAQPRLLTNLRGRSVEIDGNAHRWIVVVVLDDDAPPDETVPPLDDAKHPTVVLLRRDWEFLFEQLKSTHAVAEYFERVAGEAIQLGDEPLRYYDLAQEDAATPPAPFPEETLVAGMEIVSTPLLPLAPVAASERKAHSLVRMILEDIATTRLTQATEHDRLVVLAQLDRLPVGQRAGIGEFLLDAMAKVAREGDEEGIAWRMRSVRGRDRRTHLGYGVCSRPHDETIQHAFGLWAQLRHYDVLQTGASHNELQTVAVVLTPPRRGHRRWDTTMVSVFGDVGFDAETLATLRSAFPGASA
jgi:hypothetical protein